MILIIAILFISSSLSDEDVKDYDLQKLLNLYRSVLEYGPNDVTTKDVTFYLYTEEVKNLQIPLNSTEHIDLTKNSKFVIHGWIDNHNRSWYHHLTDEYLKKGGFNIIHVDWWRVAHSFYLSSVHNTKLVGDLVARFILNHKFDPKNIHMIGHSLGAHIAGFAAQTINNVTGTKVKRITGLDPAGPAFLSFVVNKMERLNEDDADIVDVIHTDGGAFGYYPRVGTFDIYVNGGTRIQPDCYIDFDNISSISELFEDMYCSHTRSYVRFIEIINDKKFTCQRCDSWVKYMLGLCSLNDNYVFGAEDINETMQGVCFVDTTNKSNESQ